MKGPSKLKIYIFRLLWLGMMISISTLSAGAAERSSSLTITGSSAPEAQITFAHTIRIPMLTGEGPLFSNNSLRVRVYCDATPVSAGIGFNSILTPIAIAELSAGLRIGSGWTLPGNFLTPELAGLQTMKNNENNDHKVLKPDPWGGGVFKGHLGGALQFDTAAIWPGEWKSVVMRAYNELNYQALLGDEGTYWETNLGGRRTDGWEYFGSYVIAYQMPLLLNTFGFLLETEIRDIFAAADGPSPMWTSLGIILNFGLTDNINLTLLPQINNWETSNEPATRERKKVDFKFQRLAFMLSIALQ